MNKKLLNWIIPAALLLTAGCGNSDSFVFTNPSQVQPQPQPEPKPPVAADDAFQALGSATVNYSAANGVLVNDTVNGAIISAFDAVGNQGGALALNANGSLSYSPVFGFVGSETFDYTLSNDDGESTATITLTSTGQGWFVNNQAGTTGDGSQADPFDTLAEAVSAAGTGDTIYVARGDGTNMGMTGGLNLPPGVNLIGEGTGLILAQTIEPAGEAPIIEGPIVCGGDNTIQGLTIDGSADDLIVIDNVGNVTLERNTLSGARSGFVTCNNVSGTLRIVESVIGPHSTDGGAKVFVEVLNESTDATVVVTDNTYLKVPGLTVEQLMDFRPAGTTGLDITFSRNTALGTPTEQFSSGFYLDNSGSGTCTVNIDGNNFSYFSFAGLWAFASGGPVTGSIANNTLRNVAREAIFASVREGALVISGNVVDSAGEEALSFYFDASNGAFQILGNTVTNSDVGILIEDTGSTSSPTDSFALRDNSLSNAVAALRVRMRQGGSVCADITGNQVNQDMIFETVDGSISVERLDPSDGGPLQSVNTFTNGATVQEIATSGPITSVAAGACQIP